MKVSDSDILYEDLKKGWTVCPNFSIDISENGKWLSEIIPSCPFDVEQGGNVRKIEEAESPYDCAIVCIVLKYNDFIEELKKVINNYKFDEFYSVGNCLNFKDLIDSWLDYQSIIINVSVSAAKYRISDLKKDTEKFLRDVIPQDAVLGLRELATTLSIKSLIVKDSLRMDLCKFESQCKHL